MLVLLLALAPAAFGADHPVSVTSDVFTPRTVTIGQGDSVTWQNTAGSHNVHFDDDSFVRPTTFDQWPAPWTEMRAFSALGTFRYYCEAHGGPGGMGMSGTVVVSARAAPRHHPAEDRLPAPTPGQPVSPLSDKTAPKVQLDARSAQRALLLSVVSNEAATVTVRGTIAVPNTSRVYKLKKITRKLRSGAERKLTLRLSAKTLAAVRRSLRRGVRLKAKLTISVTDRAGNARSLKRNVRLRR